MVSLIVVALTNLLEMSSQDIKVYTTLERLKFQDNLRKEASEIITEVTRMKKKGKQMTEDERDKIRERLTKAAEHFHHTRE